MFTHRNLRCKYEKWEENRQQSHAKVHAVFVFIFLLSSFIYKNILGNYDNWQLDLQAHASQQLSERVNEASLDKFGFESTKQLLVIFPFHYIIFTNKILSACTII